MKLPSLQNVFASASSAFRRFPLSLIFAILGSFTAMYIAEEKIPFESHYTQFTMICSLGLTLFFSFAVFFERNQFSSIVKWISQAIGLALLALYYFSLPTHFELGSMVQYTQYVICLHLLCSFAPYLLKPNTAGFWQYNKSLFLRFLLSAGYSAVLYIGLSIALVAVQQLFNIKIPGIRFFQLFIFISGIFHTWFFLSGINSNFSEYDSSEDYPKGLKIFTQFVLLPLVSMYLLILYAYLFKIMISWTWPIGWVSYLVLGFSTAGVFSLLLIYPVQNSDENKWMKIFSRWFFIAVFPLIVLLILAIWRRVSEYGITEKRYFVMALAGWLFFVAIYFSFKKFKHILLIPLSLFIICFLTSFGPWGAFSVSKKSQLTRFEYLMNKNHRLVNGKIVKSTEKISLKDEKQISSEFQYLLDVHGYHSVQKFCNFNLDSVKQNKEFYLRQDDKIKIFELAGIKYYDQWDMDATPQIAFAFAAESQSGHDLMGFERSYFFSESINGAAMDSSTKQIIAFPIGADSIHLSFNRDGFISVYLDNEAPLKINLNQFLKSLEDSSCADLYAIPAENLKMDAENYLYKMRVYLRNFSGNKEENKSVFTNVEGVIYLKRKLPENNPMNY